MEKVRRPIFNIELSQYGETLIDLQKATTDITYSEAEDGEADEVRISIQDRQDYLKRENYPKKGDVLRLKIGYEGEYIHDCGAFEVDEVEYSAPPDALTLKALSTNITKPLRQDNTIGYENKTLKAVAEDIAKKQGLKAVTGIDEDIKMIRITQPKKSDLSFLKELAGRYNYVFKVEDNKLVFYSRDKLLASGVIGTFDKSDLISISLRDKTQEVYKGCEVSYHCPKTKKDIRQIVFDDSAPTNNLLKLNERVEDEQQARLKAKAAIKRHNELSTEGSISIPGNIRMLSGANIAIKGIWEYDGKYHICKSSHKMSRSGGYTTDLEIKKIRGMSIRGGEPATNDYGFLPDGIDLSSKSGLYYQDVLPDSGWSNIFTVPDTGSYFRLRPDQDCMISLQMGYGPYSVDENGTGVYRGAWAIISPVDLMSPDNWHLYYRYYFEQVGVNGSQIVDFGGLGQMRTLWGNDGTSGLRVMNAKAGHNYYVAVFPAHEANVDSPGAVNTRISWGMVTQFAGGA